MFICIMLAFVHHKLNKFWKLHILLYHKLNQWPIFLGVWCRCEAFSTYPRTYDLLHAWEVFSEIEERGCSLEDLLIEMDRMLRPEGFVIIRDKPTVINYIRKFVAALRWDGWMSEVEPRSDALSSSEERVLIAKKKLWNDGLQ